MRFLRKERAQSTTEFVVILPLLLLFIFLAIDFGWLLKNWIVVTNAAREATRCASANSCQIAGASKTPIEVATARVRSGITGNLIEPGQVKLIRTTTNNPPKAGDSIIVCLKYGNKYISPVPPMFSLVTGNAVPNPLPVGAREEMRLEQDADPAWGTFEYQADGGCHFS